MSAPTQFRAGDSVGWTETLPDYPPADGWVLKYRLLWPSGSPAEIESSSIDDEYEVQLSAAATSLWQAGAATLLSLVERGAERKVVGAVAVSVLPDLGALTTYDERTRNQRALEDARSALEAYLKSGRMHVGEYEIAGRRMRFRTADEIQALIEHYERECARERAAVAALDGRASGRVITRF